MERQNISPKPLTAEWWKWVAKGHMMKCEDCTEDFFCDDFAEWVDIAMAMEVLESL